MQACMRSSSLLDRRGGPARSPFRSADHLGAKNNVSREAGSPSDRRRRAFLVGAPRYPAEQRGCAAAIDPTLRLARLRQSQREYLVSLSQRIVAVLQGLDAALFAAMEKQLDVVRPRHHQLVFDHDPPRAFLQDDSPPMRDLLA